MCHLVRLNAVNYTHNSPRKQNMTLGSLWKIDNVCLYCQIWSFDPWRESSLRILAGIQKEKNILQLQSKLWEYLCNWANCLAAFSGSKTAGASYKYIFICMVYKYWFSHYVSLWIEKHLIHRGQKSPFLYFPSMLIRVARPNHSEPNWCVHSVGYVGFREVWSHFKERFFKSA